MLAPEIAAYLAALPGGGAFPVGSLPLPELRARMEAGYRSLLGDVDVAVEADDLALGAIPARIYRPAGVSGVGGALVYFHGGGFVVGSIESHDGLCRLMAAAAGCTVVSVGYRLAPEQPFPAAVEDAWEALGRVYEVAGRLGVDRARLAVGGDSAGGALAAVAARRARDHGGPPLRLQLLLCPVLDAGARAEAPGGGSGGLDRETMDWFWARYLPAGTDPLDPDVSPAREARLDGLPPALIVTAEHDPLADEADGYAARLRAAGVPVEQHRFAGMIHGFFRMRTATERADEALELCATSLRAALG